MDSVYRVDVMINLYFEIYSFRASHDIINQIIFIHAVLLGCLRDKAKKTLIKFMNKEQKYWPTRSRNIMNTSL